MSHQNSIEQKRLRRSVRELRKAQGAPYETKINVVDYLVDRKIARTRRQARQALVAGKVSVDGAIVGRTIRPYVDVRGKPQIEVVPVPLVPSSYKGRIELFGTNVEQVLASDG